MSPLVSTFAGAALRPYGFTLGGAAPAAFELISTQILTGTASSVTFNSIPSNFKHLQVRVVATSTSTGSGTLAYRFNGDSGSNYSWHYLATNGSSVTSSNTTTTSYIQSTLYYWGMNTTFPMAQITDILDYANTNKYKTLRALSGMTGTSANELGLHSGLWQNTSAINSITIFANNSPSGSRFSLYGVQG